MRTETAQRVVVLGREGPARDQLVDALGNFGVEPLWVGRPGQNNPESLLSLNPNKIVVSLEPAIEYELEPYGEILGQPGISVVYDDAESSKGLHGWDLNRWARHFAAKLLGRSPLPPMPGSQSVSVPEPAPVTQADVEDFPHVPAAVDFTAETDASTSTRWQDDSHYEELEIDQGELQQALEQLNRNLSEGYSEDAVLEFSFEQLTPLSDDENRLLPESINESLPAFTEAVTEPEWHGLQPAVSVETIDDSAVVSDDDELRAFLAANAATVEQAGKHGYALELAPADATFADEVKPQPTEAPVFDLSKYTLIDHNPEPDGEAGSGGGVKPAMAEAEPRVRDGGKSGLFMVISGVGSPGALRSLLAQVPAEFQGVIALSHQIDSTQIPAFRGQLQKVSNLPLEVIEDNEYVKNGNVYLLQPNSTLFKTPLGYQCIRGGLEKFIGEINHDAEILILSGADASLSQTLIQVSAVSNNVHVQSPDECYESGLVRQLVNAGAPVLDRNIIDQWFN